jgi:putative phage-type endonuclease
MRFTIHDAEQGTPEWLAARAGRVTGSRAGDMLAKGQGLTRKAYRDQLVAERLTGLPQENGFISAAMKWGTENEPFARMAYEARTGFSVRQTGFLAMDSVMAGCSLDGDVDDFDGIVEFKCPDTTTHLAYLEAGKVPAKYLPQVTHNLWVTGAAWCDFASYDPRLPDNLQLFVARVNAMEVDIGAYEKEALAFLEEVSKQEQKFRSYK